MINLFIERGNEMISVQGLTKSYHDKKVLADINFEIGQGEIAGLVGPNGVGKTTLLSCMMGLIKADSGTVTMADELFTKTDMYKKVGFMQDNSVLYPHLTGYDHLSYVAYAQNLSLDAVEEVSKHVGNDSYLYQKVGEYSLGMKQHLLFASAIIHKPKVLLLDEPFNGLDPTSLIRIREIIRELAAQGTTVLLSSHNLNELDRMTRHIYFLKDGDIIYRDLADHHNFSYVLTVTKQPVGQQYEDIQVKVINDTQFIVDKENLNQAISLLNQDDNPIVDIERTQFSSENLYREIYQEV